MKKKTNRLIVISILFLFVCSMFLSLYKVNAVSTETTGLVLNFAFGSNNGRYVQVGIYDIFCTDKKLLFYLSADATLAKTSDIAFGHTPNGVVSSVIKYWNTTHIIVSSFYSWTGAGNRVGRETFLVNINTLAYTDFCTDMTDVSVDGSRTHQLISANSGIYSINTAVYTNPYNFRTYLEKLYPSYSMVGYSSYGELNDSSAIIIPSANETNIIYLIGHGSSGAYRYNIYKMNLNDNTTTIIGTSATDNTWSTNAVYNIGYSYDTDGSSYWYDIGVVQDEPSTTKSIDVGLIRFNDTFVDINHRVTGTVSSAVNLIRCLSVPYSGIRANTSLLVAGDYRFVYVGTSYAIMQVPFSIIGLDTNFPNVTMPFPTPYTYQGGTHYYGSANAVGGLQVESSNVALLIDFQNNKAVAGLWSATNPSFSFIFNLSPTPIQLINSAIPYRAVCYQSTVYNLTGNIYQSQLLQGNGTYTVKTTGLSLDYNIETTGIYGNVATTGTITNGILSFLITQRMSVYVTIYEGIQMNLTVNGSPYLVTIKFVWTTTSSEDGLLHVTPIPSPTSSSGADSGIGFGGGFVIGYFGGVVLIIIFALLFGSLAGKDGLLVGIMLAIFIASISGLFPIYGIIIAIIIGAVLIVSHTGFGGNNQ